MPEEDDRVDEELPGDDEDEGEELTERTPARFHNGISFKTLVKVFGGIGTIIGVIAAIIGFGVKFGEIKKQIDSNTKAVEKLSVHPEKCRANLGKLRDAVQERFRQDSNAVSEIRGSLMALRTEVRVRHEERTFTTRMIPSYKVSLPGMPPGFDPSGSPPENMVKVKVKGKGNRLPPQNVQEDLAAEATDLEIEQALEAAPMEDPLERLTF